MGLELAKAFVTIQIDASQVDSGLGAVQTDVMGGLQTMQTTIGASLNRAATSIKTSAITAAAPWTMVADSAKLVGPAIDVSTRSVTKSGKATKKAADEAQPLNEAYFRMRNLGRALKEDEEDLAAAIELETKATKESTLAAKQKERALTRYRMSTNQAVFGIQDFVQVLSQPGMGFADAVRASSNNLQQTIAILAPGFVGALAGFVVAFAPAIAKMFEFEGATEEAGDELDTFLSKLKELQEFMKQLREENQKRLLGEDVFDVNQLRHQADAEARIREEQIRKMQGKHGAAADKALKAQDALNKAEDEAQLGQVHGKAAGPQLIGVFLRNARVQAKEAMNELSLAEQQLVKARQEGVRQAELTEAKIANLEKEQATKRKAKRDAQQREEDAELDKEGEKLTKTQSFLDKLLQQEESPTEKFERRLRLIQKRESEGFLDPDQARTLADKAERDFIKERLDQEKKLYGPAKRPDPPILGSGRTTFAALGGQIQDALLKSRERAQQLAEQQKTNKILLREEIILNGIAGALRSGFGLL